ncbi:MAG: hypothetical protein J1E83_12615 [Lachnospiraceae bacterium]|nr:hypothetical protein [Lachnospiraceae bacterium]
MDSVVIDFVEILKTKHSSDNETDEISEIKYSIDNLTDMVQSLCDLQRIAQDKDNAIQQQYISDIEGENAYLKEQNSKMKMILKKCIPMHTMLFLVVNMGIIVGASIFLALSHTMHIYVLDPYYLVCALLISSTLFFTALISLFEWRKLLRDEKER